MRLLWHGFFIAVGGVVVEELEVEAGMVLGRDVGW